MTPQFTVLVAGNPVHRGDDLATATEYAQCAAQALTALGLTGMRDRVVIWDGQCVVWNSADEAERDGRMS